MATRSTRAATTRPPGSSPVGARPFTELGLASRVRELAVSGQPVDPEQDQRADDRGYDPGAAARRVVPAESPTQEAGDQGAGDAEQHGDDDAAGILPRHDELGQRTNHQPNDECPDDRHG